MHAVFKIEGLVIWARLPPAKLALKTTTPLSSQCTSYLLQSMQFMAPPFLQCSSTCMARLAHQAFGKSWHPKPRHMRKEVLAATAKNVTHSERISADAPTNGDHTLVSKTLIS